MYLTHLNAGGDGNAKVCNDGSTLNLNGLLNNGAQTGVPGCKWVVAILICRILLP